MVDDLAGTVFLKKHGSRLKTNHPGFMVGVGAHHDGFLAPFAENGWKIIAFEPILRTEKYCLDSLVMFQMFRLLPWRLSVDDFKNDENRFSS